MTVTLLQYFIVCPLVCLAGFVDAIAGGGGLISLPAYMLAGIPVHHAIGTNKLSSGMGTALSTANFAMKGYIPLKAALPCVGCALVGAYLGSHLSLLLDEGIFKIMMLFILPLTAYYVTRNRHIDDGESDYPWKKTLLISLPVSLCVAVYDGFYGPGTGTFLILMLTGIAHMKLQQAAGITKAINLTTNLTSLFVFLTNGVVILPLGICAGFFGMLGNWLGARMFTKDGSKIVRPLMLCVLTIFFIRIVLELTGVM